MFQRPFMLIVWLLALPGGWGVSARGAAVDGAEKASADTFVTEVRPLAEQYCRKCHGPDKAKGGFNLAPFTNTIAVYREAAQWAKAAEQVRKGEMPPEGKPQPTAAERERWLGWIDHALADLNEGRLPPDPGRVLIHRLSRTEYNCTIRDFLGLDTQPADTFPADGGGGGGFDNNADTLFVPPILMERFLAAAAELAGRVAPEWFRQFDRPGGRREDETTARRILNELARHGYRRPATAEEVDGLLGRYQERRRAGKDFTTALRASLTAVLASPNFLFRAETEQPGATGPYRINDYELASRLSYFLWSSLPDAGLFALAEQRKLHEPAVLDGEVRRMLADPKARELADNFAGQWLRVRELRTTAQPDAHRFPEFTPALREAMYGEVTAFFGSVLRENASLLRLLDADYTYVNADLAKFYELPAVSGAEMQRVTLPDARRGGVLGMAAVLTLTSYPQRTSPVLRGKWVLEEILGTPPPPPPPLVKSLPTDDHPKEGLTFRQQLEQHRKQPECAGCHRPMDPLGFGLENFDAIGRWRTQIGGQPVDAGGELPGGVRFTGPAELRRILLGRKEDFVRHLTAQMLAYALGRGLDYYDMPTVNRISRQLAANDYRSAVLVAEIARSLPFQYRRNEPSLAGAAPQPTPAHP